MKKTEIVLISTGAIGDAILASALQKSLNEAGYSTGLVSAGFTLPLWKGLENVSTYAFRDNKSIPTLPEDAIVVNLGDYLSNMPYTNSIPEDFTGAKSERLNHLSEWMAYTLYSKTGLRFLTTKGNVRIVLDKEEVKFGRDGVYSAAKGHKTKKAVVISPYSSAKNKNLPRDTLEKIVEGLKDVATLCLLTPYAENQRIPGTLPIGNKDIRKATAILLAAHAYVGVDSGPLHMLMGAIQGTPEENLVSGINIDPEKAIIALGSSGPLAVAYKNNQVLTATGNCSFAPCGAHGYVLTEPYSEVNGAKFYPTTKDRSGCVFEDYELFDTAPCMESISAEEIIECARTFLKKL